MKRSYHGVEYVFRKKKGSEEENNCETLAAGDFHDARIGKMQ